MRPQLLDRFGMSVSVSTMMDVDVRTQMVLDRLAYEQVNYESGIGPPAKFGASCGISLPAHCVFRQLTQVYRHLKRTLLMNS